ncbi:hypothetical protein CS8_008820 [Cupriavidus sp. 8B]
MYLVDRRGVMAMPSDRILEAGGMAAEDICRCRRRAICVEPSRLPQQRGLYRHAREHHRSLQLYRQSGKRLTTAAMLDYNFSKRTDVYVAVDYTDLSGAWIPL